MNNPRIDIKKAVVKKDRLNVVFAECFLEANYNNMVTKNCDQIVHSDLLEALARLKMHLVVLAEQPEAENITLHSFQSPGYAETLPNYIITGFSNDEKDGRSGVSIMATKLLKSGKTVDLKVFAEFLDEEYPYTEELSIDAAVCNEEVNAYLFDGKWGIVQATLDFDCDEPSDANITGVDMKPKRRKKRKTAEEKADVPLFDATA